jgi:hypothetical protein
MEWEERPRKGDLTQFVEVLPLMEGFAENEQPFSLWASFFDPHPKYLAPEPWDTMYDPDELTVPSVYEGEHANNPPHFHGTPSHPQTLSEMFLYFASCYIESGLTDWPEIQIPHYGANLKVFLRLLVHNINNYTIPQYPVRKGGRCFVENHQVNLRAGQTTAKTRLDLDSAPFKVCTWFEQNGNIKVAQRLIHPRSY